nr:glycine cleavage system protein GcvH [Burkholderia territorii]
MPRSRPDADSSVILPPVHFRLACAASLNATLSGREHMSELRYTESHEWLRVEADGSATVGITDHAQSQLGDLVYVALPREGDAFAQHDEAATVESVKAAGEVKMPVSGTVVEANAALADTPSLVNDSAERDGWFFRMHIDSPEQLAGLMDAAAYRAYIGE